MRLKTKHKIRLYSDNEMVFMMPITKKEFIKFLNYKYEVKIK